MFSVPTKFRTYRSFPFLLLGLLFLSLPKAGLLAQVPVFKFLSDSAQIGEHTQAVFYYKHASDQEIIFPDSNYNYKPFEFVSKTYFPTQSADGESMDSVVYTFSIFEIEGTHTLQLPVIQFRGKDTLKIFAHPDSLSIKPLITVPTDSLKLKSNTQLLELEYHFNYPILGISVTGILVLAILIFMLFGKNIFKEVKKYRRKIAHALFLKQFDSKIANVASLKPEQLEEVVALWKKYIENLEDKPYTTYTSSEIGFHLKNDKIKKNLQNIDVAIYSGRSAEVTNQDFMSLREVAVDLYTLIQSDKKK